MKKSNKKVGNMSRKNSKIHWSKIWQEIAEIYNTPWKHRSEKQKDISRLGLCFALEYFNVDVLKRVSFIRALRPKKGVVYWWLFNKNGDKCRSIFAGLMAAMSDEEFQELID